jgi:hypothetical protein
MKCFKKKIRKLGLPPPSIIGVALIKQMEVTAPPPFVTADGHLPHLTKRMATRSSLLKTVHFYPVGKIVSSK